MSAFVRGVIAASMERTSTLNVSGSMSQKTGSPPAWNATFAVAM